jgi:hypothetical protein
MGRPRKETTDQIIKEQPIVILGEAIEAVPFEAPIVKPVCGIGGCETWYDDPEVMRKHRIRQHGVRE